jgi:hypothetical protein
VAKIPWMETLGWLAGRGVLGGLLATAAATAAQQSPLTPEQLATRAEAVVHGRVEAVETRRESTVGQDGLVTRVELAVTEVWKGAATNRWVITQPGGTLGTRRVVVMGDAQFVPGQEVVVFAVTNRAGEWLSLELSQGTFQVDRTPGGSPTVRNPYWGGTAEVSGFRPKSKLPLSLTQLKERVLEANR